MRRLYPRLRLKFSRAHGRYVLLARGKKTGRVSILRILSGPGGRFVRPTLGLVMPLLKESYVGHLTTEWARDRFEREMEQHNQGLEAKKQKDLRDFIRRDGADRLRHEFTKLPGMLGRG